MRSWGIARFELLRMLRDRTNIFFVFVFPLLLVVLIGAQFGGRAETALGVVAPAGDRAVEELLTDLDAIDRVVLRRFADEDQLRREVDRGLLGGGIVVPEGYGASIDAVSAVSVGFIGRPDDRGRAARTLVATVLTRQAAPGQAAAAAASQLGTTPAELRPVAVELRDEVAGIEVTSQVVGVDELQQEFAGLGQFDHGASTQLFLFTFLTSLFGGAALIQTRRLGVASRMLATSTSLPAIILGQGLGRLLIAVTQALYIVSATVLLFRVDWGDILASSVVILLFCAVSAATGLLLGATLRNDSQASGVALGVGLGAAALGGSMVPLEIFPDNLQVLARLTPHAWANDAMADIVRRDASLVDVLPQAGVLAAMATVLLVVGGLALRRSIAR